MQHTNSGWYVLRGGISNAIYRGWNNLAWRLVWWIFARMLHGRAIARYVLQRVAACCSVLQSVAECVLDIRHSCCLGGRSPGVCCTVLRCVVDYVLDSRFQTALECGRQVCVAACCTHTHTHTHTRTRTRTHAHTHTHTHTQTHT